MNPRYTNVDVEQNQHEPHRSVKFIAQPGPATRIHFRGRFMGL